METKGKRNINILVIDDHLMPEIDFHKIFNEKFFKVYSANGNNNGIEIAERYHPDLIIGYLSLLSDSKKFLQSISLNESINNIPFIHISSNNSKVDFREIMNLGADDYFFKDFDKLDLVKSVKLRTKKKISLKKSLMEICERTFEIENTKQKDHVLVTIGNKLQLIKFEQIICVTAEKEYSKIRTKNGKSIIIRKSLKSWMDYLPENDFLRIHRQSIININAIEKIERLKTHNYIVYLKSLPKPLELSRRYSRLMKKTFLPKN